MGKRFHVEFTNTPFLRTSNTAAHPSRLNWRAEILLSKNQKAIKGKTILDLASHDGRFSWACLELGASHVTGVEGRRQLVESATENLIGLGYKPDNFTFIQGDMFDHLHKVKPEEFDTVLCFGFFYHTVRQNELLSEMKRIQATYFILDTYVAKGAFILLPHAIPNISKSNSRARLRQCLSKYTIIKESVAAWFNTGKGKPCLVFRPESHLVEAATIDPVDLVAWPTESYIDLVFTSYGFNSRRLVWNKKEIIDWTAIEDYKAGDRVSYIAEQLS